MAQTGRAPVFTEAPAPTAQDLAAVQQQVRARVLRWFARAGHLDQDDARDMAGWHHGGGFSLDASVRIEGHDRAGLERLLRYCARPPFALERLEQLAEDALVYRFPKPQPDGRTQLRLTPLSAALYAHANPPGGAEAIQCVKGSSNFSLGPS